MCLAPGPESCLEAGFPPAIAGPEEADWKARPTERPGGAAAKYGKGVGGPAQRPRAVQMVLLTRGQPLPPDEKRRVLNPDACRTDKSSRQEQKSAHSCTEYFQLVQRSTNFSQEPVRIGPLGPLVFRVFDSQRLVGILQRRGLVGALE